MLGADDRQLGREREKGLRERERETEKGDRRGREHRRIFVRQSLFLLFDDSLQLKNKIPIKEKQVVL